MFSLAEIIAITLATATSDTHHCTCLVHLGLHDTDRIVSISCCLAQGGQGKNILCRFMSYVCHCRRCFCQNNIANVNDPLVNSSCKLITTLSNRQASLIGLSTMCFVRNLTNRAHYWADQRVGSTCMDATAPDDGTQARLISLVMLNLTWTTDKLKLTGRNLGRVFKSRLGRVCIGLKLYTFCKTA